MSKTLARSISSSLVSRSKRSVPSPASLSWLATNLFLGLCLLLPLPCTKITVPVAFAGTVRWPSRTIDPLATRSWMSSSRSGVLGTSAVAFLIAPGPGGLVAGARHRASVAGVSGPVPLGGSAPAAAPDLPAVTWTALSARVRRSLTSVSDT